MSQKLIAYSLACLCLLCLNMTGCGDKNQKNIFDPVKSTHKEGWAKTHASSAAETIESCKECHGAFLTGGISKVSCMSATAISGFRCHITSPADNPSGCASCHGGPPYGPSGDAAPNRNYAHTKCTIVSDCKTCHLGAGFGTANHSRADIFGDLRRASVLMSDNVRAKTITTTFSYDTASQKCFGVSCHGGQPSTPWNEKINLVAGDNTVCFQCHELGTPPTTVGGPPSPQYNSLYSGTFSGYTSGSLHKAHIEREKYCTNCHNIQVQTDYQMHFSGIAVNNPSGTATDRFVDPGRSIGGPPTSIGSYNKTDKVCFNVTCHTLVPKSNISWINKN